MPGLTLSVLLTVAAEMSIVVQQVLNSNLRIALNSAVRSSFMSYTKRFEPLTDGDGDA